MQGSAKPLSASPGSSGLGGQIIRIPATQNIISASGDGIQLPGNRQVNENYKGLA